MTEAEWMACADPQPMLEFLQGKASDRKWRLFAVACCRRIWHLLTDERSRMAVEIAEQFAEGSKNRTDLLSCWAAAEAVIDPWSSLQEAEAFPSWRQTRMERHPGYIADCASDPDVAFAGAYEIILVSPDQERLKQSLLFRCIFGPLPFRPVTLDPAWLTPTVKQLAEAIYQERAFERMPILADALSDGGCDNQDILNHCRQPGEHVKGCWVLDLLLGKS